MSEDTAAENETDATGAAPDRAILEARLEDQFSRFEKTLQLFDSSPEGEGGNAFRAAHGILKKINALHDTLGYPQITFRQIFEQAASNPGGGAGDAALAQALQDFQSANAELKDNENRLMAKISRLEILLGHYRDMTARELVAERIIDPADIRKMVKASGKVASLVQSLRDLGDSLKPAATGNGGNTGAYPAILDSLLGNDAAKLEDADISADKFWARTLRRMGFPADGADIILMRRTLAAQKKVIDLYGKTSDNVDKIDLCLTTIAKALADFPLRESTDKNTPPEVMQALDDAQTEIKTLTDRLAAFDDIRKETDALQEQKQTLEEECDELRRSRESLKTLYRTDLYLHETRASKGKRYTGAHKQKEIERLEDALKAERDDHAKTREHAKKVVAERDAAVDKLAKIENHIAQLVVSGYKTARDSRLVVWGAGLRLTAAFAAAAGGLYLGMQGAALLRGALDSQWGALAAGGIGFGSCVGIPVYAISRLDGDNKIDSAVFATFFGGIAAFCGALATAFSLGYTSIAADKTAPAPAVAPPAAIFVPQ